MGISSKKTTTASTTNTSGTSTSTPNVPQWGVDSLSGLNDMIQNIAGTNPSTFVAPASALQNKAFAGAQDLTNSWQPAANEAQGLALSTVGGPANTVTTSTAGPASHVAAASGADSISKYLNPYLDSVVGTTLAGYDKNAGAQQAQLEAAGARNGAFGGSRFGLAQGEQSADLAQGRAQTEAQLRSQAYQDAEGQAQQDASRQQAAGTTNAGADNQTAEFNATANNQTGEFNAGENDAALNRTNGVAQLLANLSNSGNANSIADLTAQAGLGDTQRGITQATDTAPISLAQTVAQLLQQNQLPLLTGQTTDSTGTTNSTGSTTSAPSTFSQIGQGISTAANLAALFSDRRLKRDIEKIGELANGLGVYVYRYLWSPLRWVGVMAQEVLKVKPEAVIIHPSGFLMVDYGAL